MSKKLEEFEKQLKKKDYKKSVFDTLKDTLDASVNDFQKTVATVFSTPTSWKNQITKEQEKYEKKIIKKRRKF